ncbi:MAG: hypothetical protein E6H03_12770 [Bacillati bacterium ANGP1]|uniref:Cation/H+ exchanger transmembrane domain-containing protein n=1 Tax=Candidatus Segetimicrobium genomatis TaxID=2569760 RepID=A0A537J3C2_9BACT|nr:MAG: hypothetical protein E6H03_12770 [Terrabacteria group bacterium ANGP1]
MQLALVFMVAAAVVAIVAQRLRFPYTVALVIAGLAAGALRLLPPVAVSSEVLLTIVIPPLLFEGALHLAPAHLRAYGLLIGLLAIPGTLVAAVGIGWAAAAAGVPPQAAMLLGVIAAAIDPVSVIALVREAGLDPRLAAILEGEAVLNDGVAIVLFTIVSGPAAGGFWPAAGGFWPAAGQFVWLIAAGGVVGVLLAAGVSYVLGRVAQPLVETLGSLILLVGSLLAAGRLGASGIIAVMCAGVVFASSGRRSLTGAGQETLRTVWDFLAFLANSALFLFIGLQVTGAHLVRHGMLIAVVIAAALAARALTVYGFAAVSRPFGVDIPTAWRHVLFWGGLRGGVAIALVLDLGAGLPGHDDVAAAVFGLVVFTLIGQGLSMQPLMRRVGLLPAT